MESLLFYRFRWRLSGPAFPRSRPHSQAQTRLILLSLPSINTGTRVVFVEITPQSTPNIWGILPPKSCIPTPSGSALSHTPKKSLMEMRRECTSICSTWLLPGPWKRNRLLHCGQAGSGYSGSYFRQPLREW